QRKENGSGSALGHSMRSDCPRPTHRRFLSTAPAAAQIAPSRLPRDKVGEIEDIGVWNRLKHFGHRRLVSSTYAGFVLAHRLEEKILPLTRDAGDAIATRQVAVMADVAPVLAYERSPALHACRVSWVACGRRGRQLGDGVGKCTQVIVREALDRIVHDVQAAHLFTKQEQLDKNVG